MSYPEMFKRKMVQKLSGSNALTASELSRKIDIPQPTLSRWLKDASFQQSIGFSSNFKINSRAMAKKQPTKWNPERKFKAVNEAALLSDEKLGAFLRREGIHETHLEQWRLQMLNGLNPTAVKKTKAGATLPEKKRIKSLEKELRRKDKALAETAALLVLKKKVQEIWGDEDDSTMTKSVK